MPGDSPHDDHLRRVRFNASSITVKDSNPGETFRQVLELYVIYISETDFLKEKKTTYHVDKVIRETGTVIDDGLHEIFVNAQIKDGTDISELMSCFLEKKVSNPKFPALSEGVTELKETEGGISSMCKVMNHYEEIARKQGIQQGRDSLKYEVARDMIRDGEPVEKIVRYSQLAAEEILKLRSEMDSASA